MFTSSMGRASASPSWRPPSWGCICNQRKDLAMRMKTISALPWFIVLAAVPTLTSCAIKNDIQAAASGCDEFEAGGQAVAGLGIDAKVKAFAEASVEVRCPPAELSVQCDTECKAEAVCQGHADVEANCMGKCESECTGTCSGELRGKTEGGCTGMCEGKCDGVATPSGGMAKCT